MDRIDQNVFEARFQVSEGKDKIEDTLKSEASERKERHERLIEALREKHRAVLDSRDDEITELKIKLSDL